MANLVDKIVSFFDPRAGVRREQARRALAYYEAARPDRLRKNRRETGSGNEAILRAGSSPRQQARHLEQNYDIALGVLNTLVANTVGATGIGVEPQPRMADGSIDVEFASQILTLYKDWSRRPEVTWMHDWPSAQRMLARSWFRDGEVFSQLVEGINPALDHGTRVPLSIEMLEADFVPMELQGTAPLIQQGIELNAWGRPLAYHVYKAHPNESGPMIGALAGKGQTKRISADRMLHIATRHRIRQLRGISIFAAVLNRFDDLKDYEESERIAAKVAASMAAYIRKGAPEDYATQDDAEQRQLKFRPGMIFDDLRPGEEIGMIDSKRPNPNLEIYRSGQLKAIAAGTGQSFSSVAKTYDGTYSAQRQELVEGWSAYQILAAEFTSRMVRPVYEKFIALAVLSGVLKVPPGTRLETLDDAIYIGTQMPWIDPKKEAEAWAMLEDRNYASGPEIVRKRGANPIDVLDQQKRWQREKADRGLDKPAARPAPPAVDDDEEGDDEDDKKSRGSQAVADAVRTMSTQITALASRPADPPQVHFHDGAIQVQPAAVTVEAHLPEQAAPQVDVHVEAVMPAQASPVVEVRNEIHPPAQAAPHVDVHVEAVMPASSEVAIVSMPKRETDTSFERDAAGNLTATRQTEKDA